MRVHGVDFSGAAEPGEAVWLASGEVAVDDADGGDDGDDGDDGASAEAAVDGPRLRVEACRSAAAAFDVTGRTAVLRALRSWLATREGVVGIDLSFGLPRAVLPPVGDWPAFLAWFPRAFAGADAPAMTDRLRERARRSDADGVDLKRRTDERAGASSPYSFLTRYQTLYGLRDLLVPLVLGDRVGVEPMAPAGMPASGPGGAGAPGSDRRPTLVEVYPAGTLRALGLPDERYKGADAPADARERRERILAGLEAWGLAVPAALRERALADDGGDALDSLVAAVAAARARADGFAVEAAAYDPVEGYIYR